MMKGGLFFRPSSFYMKPQTPRQPVWASRIVVPMVFYGDRMHIDTLEWEAMVMCGVVGHCVGCGTDVGLVFRLRP